MGYETENAKQDSAARAAWLYFIAGNTQEEIAQKLRISRPTAQRLVSLALSNRYVTFRFEHHVATCMELSEQMRARFGLKYCDIVPTDPSNPSSNAGVATSAAAFIEQTLSAPSPITMAVGTGRTLRVAVDLIHPMECPQHTLVALVGNIAMDGSASFFDVLSRLADLTKTRHFPIPLPVLADNEEQRDLLTSLRIVQRTHALAQAAEVTLVGVGQMDLDAPQHIDGFISREELLHQMRQGAVGEITGWSFDARGEILEGGVNARLTSVPISSGKDRLVVGVASGEKKAKSIFSAINGQIINGLITDEATATLILAQKVDAGS
ncbi:sugar-binding transcriptional regulator [Agrobacterium sp. rho-13.3]|uniref:sugar-binding transcriptional regulator n=1 Tax=Agrobacterium sp. rho-13.3 TaxID=3072980 RepID=UPI002A13DDEE|nr:sugar-binding transcriptional regulator [Agrobacterium sp. rho-13.3]MDX8309232.1 sugar-binding transcriptional regulator [Agrobacterium sp. rho-13.3]